MPEQMERLAKLETQMEQHSEMLAKISETLERLVEAMIANQGNREAIDENRERIDGLEDDVYDVRSYAESRWYVLATVVSIAVVIAQVGIAIFL